MIFRCERGFTLAELLVACAILGLALAAIVTIYQSGLEAYLAGSNQLEVQQNARAVLERMSRELREASAITVPNANSITFNDPTGAVMAYSVDGDSQLILNGAAVTGGIEALVLTYNGLDPAQPGLGPEAPLAVPVANPGDIRRITLTIRTRSEDVGAAGGVSNRRSQIATTVRLRNR
jgi:prepilin-type N-terminal cleavage/methylation domain-containing protein